MFCRPASLKMSERAEAAVHDTEDDTVEASKDYLSFVTGTHCTRFKMSACVSVEGRGHIVYLSRILAAPITVEYYGDDASGRIGANFTA